MAPQHDHPMPTQGSPKSSTFSAPTMSPPRRHQHLAFDDLPAEIRSLIHDAAVEGRMARVRPCASWMDISQWNSFRFSWFLANAPLAAALVVSRSFGQEHMAAFLRSAELYGCGLRSPRLSFEENDAVTAACRGIPDWVLPRIGSVVLRYDFAKSSSGLYAQDTMQRQMDAIAKSLPRFRHLDVKVGLIADHLSIRANNAAGNMAAFLALTPRDTEKRSVKVHREIRIRDFNNSMPGMSDPCRILQAPSCQQTQTSPGYGVSISGPGTLVLSSIGNTADGIAAADEQELLRFTDAVWTATGVEQDRMSPHNGFTTQFIYVV